MALQVEHINLARSLPSRLLNFFAKYPPSALSQSLNTQIAGTMSNISDKSSTSFAENIEENGIESTSSIPEPSNPFRSQKNPVTGKWYEPRYSLRRQADLVKLARAHGVEELLPYTTKGTQAKIEKREELGLRVKGTGVGQRPKGHKHERTMRPRLEKRKQAMLDMPEMVRNWEQVGNVQDLCNLMGMLTGIKARTWTWMEEMAKAVMESFRTLIKSPMIQDLYDIVEGIIGFGAD